MENLLACCFYLETELFTSYSLPSDYDGRDRKVCVLGDQLCVFHVLKCGRAVIWSMKNYGDENSWVKEYSFTLPFPFHVCPLSVLANGDLEFAMPFYGVLFIYSKNMDAVMVKWLLQPSLFHYNHYSSFVIYTPNPSLNLFKVPPMLKTA